MLRTLRRTAGAAVATSLLAPALPLAAAATVVALAPAAQAADPAPSLAWKISDRVDDHLSTHDLADGAT
ncbi:hypothetical protein, partial [Nocardioides sp. R-C-SC26]|uniref:hypothetical protein n=1 Tax=Nocardioides sp. R-C-SC26 TaxID=2870414 RepID=UPI001E2BCA95